jgi:hypothetical protein
MLPTIPLWVPVVGVLLYLSMPMVVLGEAFRRWFARGGNLEKLIYIVENPAELFRAALEEQGLSPSPEMIQEGERAVQRAGRFQGGQLMAVLEFFRTWIEWPLWARMVLKGVPEWLEGATEGRWRVQ